MEHPALAFALANALRVKATRPSAQRHRPTRRSPRARRVDSLELRQSTPVRTTERRSLS